MTRDYFVKQLNEIISEFQALESTAQYKDLSDIAAKKVEELTTVLTKSKAAVSRITGNSSEYYKDITTALATNNHEGTKLRLVIGIIKALKSDLENNYLKRLHEIIQADFFSDYLEMASYLLKEGYKDPAAVITGSTLEAQIRELCKTNEIEIEVLNSKEKLMAKKADTMNSDLAKKGVYTSAYQKQITAWLDIRNSAAHGHYENYSLEEIRLMLDGVRQFILATTA